MLGGDAPLASVGVAQDLVGPLAKRGSPGGGRLHDRIDDGPLGPLGLARDLLRGDRHETLTVATIVGIRDLAALVAFVEIGDAIENLLARQAVEYCLGRQSLATEQQAEKDRRDSDEHRTAVPEECLARDRAASRVGDLHRDQHRSAQAIGGDERGAPGNVDVEMSRRPVERVLRDLAGKLEMGRG